MWGGARELWFIILVISLFILLFPGIWDDCTD
ncbi:hypothetical protein SDC9_164428 [bioreactor metagenome]|uniref:Uncharacterized protein n=1 Tax=bioreactor metagenome TaxID=1076179 RepID=A0A645FRJ7_9ZZZZ